MINKIILGICSAVLLAKSAQASTGADISATTSLGALTVKHGPQGTGNYKGKRDRHEKPGPMNEKKRKKGNWIPKN